MKLQTNFRNLFTVILFSCFSLSSSLIASTEESCPFKKLSYLKEVKEGITDQVARIKKYYPNGIATPTTEEEIKKVVKIARETNTKLSIKSGGFSQGGQWAIEDGIILDLSKYKGVTRINRNSKEVVAKAGTTWKEIQQIADQNGLANTVQQSSNIFPIGGALAMNIHGRDITYGSIVNVTNWVRVLLPSGEIVTASRTKNPELFKSVIGGLGLRGVILEASLKMRPNDVYETVLLTGIRSDEIDNVFDIMRTDPQYLDVYISDSDRAKLGIKSLKELRPEDIGMGYGRAQNLNPQKDGYLDDAVFYLFVKVDKDNIKENAKTQLKKKKKMVEHVIPSMMEIQRWSHTAKELREQLELKWMRSSGSQASLNYLMDPPVEFLLFKQKEEAGGLIADSLTEFKRMMRFFFSAPVDSTDVLKEYFIPLRNVESFKQELVKTIRKHDLNNLNITYRFVPKTSKESAPLINYAKEDMVAFVVNFNVGLGKQARKNLDVWSEELVQAALDNGGVHYLAYEPNATLEQLIQAYPGFVKLFDEILAEKNSIFKNEYIKEYLAEYAKDKERFRALAAQFTENNF